MVFTKIALVGIAIFAMMVVVHEKNLAERAGVVGTCAPVQAPAASPGVAWYLCKQGILTGFPNLEADSCERAGLVAHKELWQCTDPYAAIPGA